MCALSNSEVLQFIRENDIKFIRLSFCNLFGVHKNIAVLSDALAEILEHGVPISCAQFPELRDWCGNAVLQPDPTTLTLLPWRPAQDGVVLLFCDLRTADGAGLALDGRAMLRRVLEDYRRIGLTPKVGTDCEFHLFKMDAAGDPTRIPVDQGGYFDIEPLDKCENVRRDICLTLEQMGIVPRQSYHEKAPGQNQIDFQHAPALDAADHFLTFKSVVKAIAAQNGFYASFMPKPVADSCGNGLHINLSIYAQERNIFSLDQHRHCPQAHSFIAGILRHIREITAFLNPLVCSYDRLGNFEAPGTVSWSYRQGDQLLWVPEPLPGRLPVIKLRSPDPAVNPHLALAMVLKAGLLGMQEQLQLPAPLENGSDLPPAQLPHTLEQALDLAAQSAFVRDFLHPALLDAYLHHKRAECKQKPDLLYQSYFQTI